ncbi:MAG: HIT domain-containing protein [Actinomycetota bacterium]|nr:MAG: HIT domain-containing protein [Actinomycetota bacterium]
MGPLRDRWERLWTPHRMPYLRGESRPRHDGEGDECPFCRVVPGPDADGLIVARGESAYVLLNLFPYNSGHLLVCPYRHVGLYPDLTDDEVLEIGGLTQTAMRVLGEVAGVAGFNIGMNQGSIAGAGIAGHLHQHVVPRYAGDGNFMPIIGRTKVMAQVLSETRSLLAEAWPATAVPPHRSTTSDR